MSDLDPLQPVQLGRTRWCPRLLSDDTVSVQEIPRPPVSNPCFVRGSVLKLPDLNNSAAASPARGLGPQEASCLRKTGSSAAASMSSAGACPTTLHAPRPSSAAHDPPKRLKLRILLEFVSEFPQKKPPGTARGFLVECLRLHRSGSLWVDFPGFRGKGLCGPQ